MITLIALITIRISHFMSHFLHQKSGGRNLLWKDKKMATLVLGHSRSTFHSGELASVSVPFSKKKLHESQWRVVVDIHIVVTLNDHNQRLRLNSVTPEASDFCKIAWGISTMPFAKPRYCSQTNKCQIQNACKFNEWNARILQFALRERSLNSDLWFVYFLQCSLKGIEKLSYTSNPILCPQGNWIQYA